MSKKTAGHETAEQHVKAIRRAARKQYSAEEKIRIVLEGLRGEQSIAELCRLEQIAQMHTRLAISAFRCFKVGNFPTCLVISTVVEVIGQDEQTDQHFNALKGL